MKDIQNMTAIQTTCSICQGCGLSVHVKDGKIAKIKPGDFPEPDFKWACANGLLSHKWAYHPDRLRYPLKRAGERGEGKWQRISWEEALDGISAKLIEIAEAHGPASVAWSAPEIPMLCQGGYSRLVTLTKGTWVENWGFGDLAGPNADMVTFGRIVGGVATSVESPKILILWGSNLANTFPTRMKGISNAKKNGCKIIVIDPRYTTTAAVADEHIPIRPGTDGALALGMLNVILKEGLEDVPFITEHTVGPFLVRDDNGLFLKGRDLKEDADEKTFMVWDESSGRVQSSAVPGIMPALRGQYVIEGIECRPASQLLADMVNEYPLQKVSEITEVPAETIRRLARTYATRKPAGIGRGMGMQRSFYGDLSWRAISTLAAYTGNINLKSLPTYEDFMAGGISVLYFPKPAGSYNRIPIMNLYDAITEEKPFPIKALCVAKHNYANQMPNAKKIINALFPRLELILVCDLFMTTTARYADYVLPVASHFECTDLWPSMVVPYVHLQQKAIEPLYECKSDFQIAAELGRKMGFGTYFDKSAEQCLEEIIDFYPMLEGITLDQLKEGPVKPRPLGGPPFKTPSGRIEFYVEKLRPFGQELPVYLEPVESNRQGKAKKYPLSLITPHPKYRFHSTLANVPELLKFDPEPLLEINPVDAKPRDIEDGDVIRVFNDRGKVKLRVKLTKDVMPGVVSLKEGWWPEHYMEGHHNDLTHDRVNPAQNAVLGPNAAFCDVLVEVKKTY